MVVYIVGSGPGDIELLTLKAKRLIQQAEVILYDKLVNKEILQFAPPTCELLYVGKREKHSQHSQQIQQEIHHLIKKYGKNKRVVRLKGGDPFIFGRGGEEAQICQENSIPFEIIPGISSAIACPMYAGIPLSHRSFNSSFALLTGHESDKTTTSIDWEHLPEVLIILMGVKKIQDTAQKLISVGRDPSTPVAGIQSGTTPKQLTKLFTLQQLSEGKFDLSPPVVFIVGPVVTLHEKLAWFEQKINNIKNKTIILTRAKNHTKESVDLLESYGMNVISMPLIEIVPREFNVPDITSFDALVFTSLEGVKQVNKKVDLGSFSGKIYAIGPKTKTMLQNLHSNALMGEKYNSEGLAEYISNTLSQGSRVLALRSSAATELLKNRLSKTYVYTETHVYDIKQIPANPDVVGKGDVIFVVSATCAKSLTELDPSVIKGKTVVSIGPETSRHLPFPHITASTHTIQGMIDTYLDYLWEKLT